MTTIPLKQSGLRWLWLALLVIVTDQATKLWIVANFDLYQRVEILPFFNLVYVHNPGAAFSFLSEAGGWQVWFFGLIALSVSSLLLYWLRKSPAEARMLNIAYVLVLGGALGNLYDRVAYGYVIDFLDFYWGTSHFPAFNVADSAICVGAGLLLLDAFFSPQDNVTRKPDSAQEK